MPVTLTYPGVYVEEIPSGVRTDHRGGDLDHGVHRTCPTRTGEQSDDDQQLWRL